MSDGPEIWTDDQDELRRAFILSHVGWSHDHKARSQIEALEKLFQWLAHGRVPEKKGHITRH